MESNPEIVGIDQTASPDSAQWSSAVGHASTGKSGRVIERLQQEIDRLNREKQLLRLRHEEAERATETLHTQYRHLQDRNSNYESSHEATQRQLQRKERQVTELREEVDKERAKTARAEEALRSAAISEDEWREQAHHAKAVAQQKEAEYDAIAACRNMDNDRHQNGLNRIKASLDRLLKQHDEDLEKQKRMEVIAEQRKREIDQLEELTRKLQANFNMYRCEIDSAVEDLRTAADENDRVVHDKLGEMKKITGEMRWVMNVETIVNGKQVPERPKSSHENATNGHSQAIAKDEEELVEDRVQAPPSPSKRKMTLDFRHKRKGSSKANGK